MSLLVPGLEESLVTFDGTWIYRLAERTAVIGLKGGNRTDCFPFRTDWMSIGHFGTYTLLIFSRRSFDIHARH